MINTLLIFKKNWPNPIKPEPMGRKTLKAIKIIWHVVLLVVIFDTAWAIYSLQRMNEFIDSSECGHHNIQTLFTTLTITKNC